MHNMNNSRLSVYISHASDGTLVKKNMIHDAQNVQSNLFQAYDYGSGEKKRINYMTIKQHHQRILFVQLKFQRPYSSLVTIGLPIPLMYLIFLIIFKN